MASKTDLSYVEAKENRGYENAEAQYGQSRAICPISKKTLFNNCSSMIQIVLNFCVNWDILVMEFF